MPRRFKIVKNSSTGLNRGFIPKYIAFKVMVASLAIWASLILLLLTLWPLKILGKFNWDHLQYGASQGKLIIDAVFVL